MISWHSGLTPWRIVLKCLIFYKRGNKPIFWRCNACWCVHSSAECMWSPVQLSKSVACYAKTCDLPKSFQWAIWLMTSVLDTLSKMFWQFFRFPCGVWDDFVTYFGSGYGSGVCMRVQTWEKNMLMIAYCRHSLVENLIYIVHIFSRQSLRHLGILSTTPRWFGTWWQSLLDILTRVGHVFTWQEPNSLDVLSVKKHSESQLETE